MVLHWIRSRPLTFLFLAVYLWALVFTAWVCDDAFITLRTVDNLVHGLGPTWNPMERVQVYTHPLWMLFLSGVYFFSRQAYLTALALSALCAILAVLWTAFKVFREDLQAGLVLALFCASMAFVDYSTSGLENALAYLLFSLFVGWYFRQQAPVGPRQVFLLGLFAALVALTRPDLILFFFPVFFERFLHWDRTQRLQVGVALGAGLSPLVAWEFFSLFYYGALAPNTAFAKVNTGIPHPMLLEQGGIYFLDALRWDLITPLAAILGSLASLIMGDRRQRALALGILFYLLYVAYIGGDFMRGRFFTVPFLVGSILLVQQLRKRSIGFRWWVLGLVSAFGLSSAFLRPVMMEDEPLIAENGIADERRFYYQTTGWLSEGRFRTEPEHPWVGEGVRLRMEDVRVSVQDTIGFHGYYAGPTVHILDRLALADPLLARLPIPDPAHWRIGHFERRIPEGYLETLASGENCIVDPALAEYYDHLSLAIRGDLFDRDRLMTVIKLNAGCYDDLLQQYLSRQRGED